MKKTYKILVAVFLMLACVLPSIQKLDANAWLSVSTNTVKPNGTFTATIGGLSDIRGRFDVTVNNGRGSTFFMANGQASQNINVVAGSSGNVTITVVATDATYLSEEPVRFNGQRVVTIKPSTGENNNTGGSSSSNGNSTNDESSSNGEFWNNSSNDDVDDTVSEDTLSSDANLESLTISKGKLTPEFNAETTEYKVELAASVTSVEVSAKANDSKASVSGTGKKELTPGENKIEVIVTAENKSTKTYTITAIVDEKPLTFVKYNDSELGVVRNLSSVKAPDGFEETMITIDGKDVKAWKSNNMNITIVYLIDEKTSEKNFYMYDVKENKVLSIFKPTAILGNNLFIVDIDKEHQKKNGFKYEKVKVDNVELMGWTFEDKTFKDYSLIYVMNEQGKMQYYLYEKTQNTLQLYSDAAPITQKAYDKLTNDFKHSEALKLTFMVLTGILTISTIISVITALKLRSKRERDWF